MSAVSERVSAIAEETVRGMGFELWGVEFRQVGRRTCLTVYIDTENGVSVDECADVSRQLSSVLDVEDPIAGAYDLEISSPGMDRILFNLEQVKRYEGCKISLELHEAVNGAKKLKADLMSVADSILTLQIDGETAEVPYANVRKARLVPDFSVKKD